MMIRRDEKDSEQDHNGIGPCLISIEEQEKEPIPYMYLLFGLSI
jgi:hypothetical protein